MATSSPNVVLSTDKILVKGIPASINSDKLIIYFQKRKIGGGDVACVTFPVSKQEPDTAIVTFEETNTVQSVLARSHKIGGKDVSVTVLQPQPKIFSIISAELSDYLIQQITVTNDDVDDVLENVGDSTGCTFDKNSGKYTAKGEWYQIQAAFERFEAIVSDNLGSSPSQTNGYLSRTLLTSTQSPTSPRTPGVGRPRSVPVPTSSPMSNLVPNTPSTPSPPSKQVVSTMIDKDYYAYMQLVHADDLDQIMKQYKVLFSCKILDDAAKVEVEQLGKDSDLQNALLAVNKLSQEVVNNTAQDTVMVDPKIYSSDTAENIFRELKLEFPQVHMDKVHSKPDNILFTAPNADKCRMAKEMFEFFLERAPKMTSGQAAASNGDHKPSDHIMPMDKDLFGFIKMTRPRDLQKIWDQNGCKMDVDVVDDCAYIYIIPAGPLINFNPSKAITDLKSLNDDVSAKAIQETIEIPLATSDQKVSDAIRMTNSVHKEVHISKVLVTGCHILFIAKTQQECDSAMKICENILSGPRK